jgi:predicted small lipoprotein YifL
MKLKTIILLFMILAFWGTQVGCGKKGPPVSPLIDKTKNSA